MVNQVNRMIFSTRPELDKFRYFSHPTRPKFGFGLLILKFWILYCILIPIPLAPPAPTVMITCEFGVRENVPHFTKPPPPPAFGPGHPPDPPPTTTTRTLFTPGGTLKTPLELNASELQSHKTPERQNWFVHVYDFWMYIRNCLQ